MSAGREGVLEQPTLTVSVLVTARVIQALALSPYVVRVHSVPAAVPVVWTVTGLPYVSYVLVVFSSEATVVPSVRYVRALVALVLRMRAWLVASCAVTAPRTGVMSCSATAADGVAVETFAAESSVTFAPLNVRCSRANPLYRSLSVMLSPRLEVTVAVFRLVVEQVVSPQSPSMPRRNSVSAPLHAPPEAPVN